MSATAAPLPGKLPSMSKGLRMLIPRPHSFLLNLLLFGGGLFFAWMEGYGAQEANGNLGQQAWLFVVLGFLVQELLVQQAKYMWNDIRDHERDQKIPANESRPLARQPLSRWITAVMVGRWIAGVVLAGLLSPVLLSVVLLISGLQVVYELGAKPLAARQPTLPLFVVGAGAALKAAAGGLSMGYPAGDQRLWLYGLALFATGVVYISSFWRVEAIYFVRHGLALPRGQSAYYSDKGMAWLKAGTAVTIFACTLLILDGYTHFLGQREMPTSQAMMLIFAAGTLCCQLSFTLVSAKRVVRLALVALSIAGCVAYLLLSVESLIPISNETFAAALLLLFLLLNHRLNVSIDYQRQNLIYLSANWPRWKQMACTRQRQPGAILHWRHLLQLALALNTPRFQLLRQRQEQDWPVKSHLSAVNSPARKREARGEGRPN